MNKYKALALIIALILPAAFTSCNSLLDEQPDDRITVNSPELVRRLLINAYPTATPALVSELSSDNIDDYGTDNPNYTNFQLGFAYWDDTPEYNTADGLRAIWQAHYNAIAHANKALEVIDQLGNTSALAPHRGEALLCRAYSHFVLVNVFGKHYNAQSSSSDLGVPYVTKPETELDPKYTRNTVSEVYAAIARDLQEGLPLIADSYYSEPLYHFNRSAAYAFAARFYLYHEEWDKAIAAADIALTGKSPRDWSEFQNASVVGAKTEDAYAKLYSRTTTSANFLLLPVTSGIRSFFSNAHERRFSHCHRAAAETILAANIWSKTTSPQNDYWQEPFISPVYNFRDIINQSKYPTYTSNANNTIVVPFSYEETLLVRAEAKVLNGDNAGAIQDLNAWTSAYLKVSDKTFTETQIVDFYKAVAYSTADAPTIKKTLHPRFALSGGETQEMILHHALQCRRIATLHEGLRWIDIKRYGIEVPRYVHDARNRGNVSVAKTLTSWDDHTALEIPQNAISKGMKPNRP